MINTELPVTVETNLEPNWPEHFERWRQSGLTQIEYCRQEELSRHRFKYWRRKLDPEAFGHRPKRESGFVPVKVQRSTVETNLSLALPNGMVVRGIDAGNIELVRPLVEQL